MDNIKQKKYNKIFLIGLVTGLIFRLSYISLPILEVQSFKQTHYAMIAKNFYLHAFNFFQPQLDYISPVFSFFLFKFNLFSFLTSLLYAVSGGIYEWLPRCLSIAFSIGATLFIYGFTKKLYNKKAGIGAALVFFLSPLSIIFTRTFMPAYVFYHRKHVFCL